MTLTRAVVQAFEADQAAFGTEVALFNLLWQKAADDFAAIGVRSVRTRQTARGEARRGPLPLAAFKKLAVNRGGR